MYANNVNTTSTDYVGNTAYTDGAFNYLIMGEGRITRPTGNFVYEYHLKDHLGNTRVAFEAVSSTSLAVKQRADYYPFGLQFKGNPQYLNNDNKYLYNGKELQDDVVGGVAMGWLDYGKRMYDPQLGRFTCSDPLADKFVWVSPYNYAENSPIANIDLWGLQAWNVTKQWSDQDLIEYSKYSQMYLRSLVGTKMDCADVAYSPLVNYASSHGLPLRLQNSAGDMFSSQDTRFKLGETDKYLQWVKDNLGAIDIQSNTFEVSKESTQAGDMIFLGYSPRSHHVVTYSDYDIKNGSKNLVIWGNTDIYYDRDGNFVKSIDKPVKEYFDWPRFAENLSWQIPSGENNLRWNVFDPEYMKVKQIDPITIDHIDYEEPSPELNNF